MSRVALISGGTSGIGAAIARTLQAAGYRVAVNYAFTTDRAEAFQKETGIPAFQWDVRDYDACVDGIAKVEETFGPVEVLVNNAGITRDAMFHKMSPQQWREVIDTNLTGVFNMTHPVWPGMRDRGFGRIVNISSINGQKGQAGQANYSASKAGQIGFTKALAREVASRTITVNAIAPGFIQTDIWSTVPEDAQKGLMDIIPLGRVGQPEEIAKAAAFLASDDAAYITGHTLIVDGGIGM